MTIYSGTRFFCVSVLLFFSETGRAQTPADTVLSHNKITTETSLFQRTDVLSITLSGNINELLSDRGETPQYHPVSVSYMKEDSSIILISAEAKTRGHFRKLKENCIYPPVLLNFSGNDTLESSIFKDQNKLKLVMPCQGDEYVIREWLVYQLYNLVTPVSFRSRLVRITLDDSKSKKQPVSFFGLLLEEEKQMAQRNGCIAVDWKLKPQQTQKDAFLTMAVFEYLIGNTDWSVEYLQNVKLVTADSNTTPLTVPYDFDHSGIVNTPYAKPAEELLMSSIRERRFRGYCTEDMKTFENIIAKFNNLKVSIYKAYTGCTLLDAKYVKTTTKFLDEFYETINHPAKWQKAFSYPCDRNGTGNIIIKGLRED